MSPEQIRYLKLLVGGSFEVSFSPIDILNPSIGMRCAIEGEFGRVSGDSEDSLSEAFFNATEQLSKLQQGLPSNVQPVLSLAEQVLVLPDSDLEKLRDRITTELDSRRTNYADAYR